jgi:hypothetical protein
VSSDIGCLTQEQIDAEQSCGNDHYADRHSNQIHLQNSMTCEKDVNFVLLTGALIFQGLLST